MVRKMEGRSCIEPLFDVLCLTNVIVVCCFAQENIDVERHAVKSWWSRWDSNPRPSRLSPGRANQTLNHIAVLPRLDLPFSAHSLSPGLVFFFVDQSPRHPIPERLGVVRVVVGEALFDVLRMTYVIAVCCFAQEDIDVERHAVRVGGADGIRTHDLPGCHRDALTKRSIISRSFHDLICRRSEER